ncbi:cupin domain-containing protein [Dyadobacter sp. CY261]|uniref:cupin domain-containing protein n=1 Tax=Dyadobacter sp. CY261 TaxID=2907203 RepID=UPI001F1B61BC|nr:cupin domain-containing protein [Dyadobacter sp. CY261]MCF0069287.1 cupin domain-containing protein [Dyadobacter sp. CY261]
MKNETDFLTDQLENKAIMFAPNEGELLAMGGNSITFKVTSDLSNDQLGIYEIKLAPSTIGAKLHYHRFMDETFIVRRGTLTIDLADGPIQAYEGAVVYVPRMTPHGFSNQSADEVIINLIFNPGQQREGFFRGLQSILTDPVIDAAKYLKLYQKYDSFPVNADNMLPVGAPGHHEGNG